VVDDPSSRGCQELAPGAASCPTQEADASTLVGFLSPCTGDRTVSVEFDLPTSGDLEVAVP
jgi:hypothetical protein